MAPRLPFRMPQLGPRTRKIVRWALLVVFSLFVFVFALQMTFPYGRVKDKVVDTLADKYEVTIGGVERGIMPGNVTFTAVTLRSRPTAADDSVTTFFMKRLELDAGLLSLIGGTLEMDIDAQIAAGTLSGTIAVGEFGRGDIAANFTGRALPGDALPMRAMLGLPLTGKLEFDVALNLPVEKSKLGRTSINWQKARGSFGLGCPTGCTFGDGVTKLKPLLKNARNQAMVGEGIDFGKVSMDSLVAKATIKGGKLTVDRFETKSKDGELHVDFMLTLEKTFDESMVAGCLRFKGTEDLLKREPKTYAALQTTGAELRKDGLFHIRLTDRFKSMKRLNQECGPDAAPGASSGENFDKPDRPNLTTLPSEEPRTGSGSAIAAPPPPSPTPIDPPPPPTPTSDNGNPTGGSAVQQPPSELPDGVAPPQISNDPPRERAGEQAPINAVGSGDGDAAPATPPPE